MEFVSGDGYGDIRLRHVRPIILVHVALQDAKLRSNETDGENDGLQGGV